MNFTGQLFYKVGWQLKPRLPSQLNIFKISFELNELMILLQPRKKSCVLLNMDALDLI